MDDVDVDCEGSSAEANAGYRDTCTLMGLVRRALQLQ